MKNNTVEEIWNELKKAKKVLIPLHPRPDGDSLGSCVAMSYALKKIGIKVELISKDKLSENLNDYNFAKEVKFGKDIEDFNLNDFDFIVFLDHGTLKDYSEKFINDAQTKEKIINIDHHDTNKYYGNFNYVIPNLPSCCSILFNIFEMVGVEFDKEICRRLLLGLCTDTNFGEYGNSADSFEKMAFLIKKGKINFQKEFVNIINSNPWKIKKLHGILLTNMEKRNVGKYTIAYSWATKNEYDKHGLNYSDVRLGIFCMQDIKGVDLIFTLTEMENEIKGSFRSKGLDTTIYSKEFGGGGHKQASAFIVDKQDIKKLVNEVIKIIEKRGFVEIDKI